MRTMTGIEEIKRPSARRWASPTVNEVTQEAVDAFAQATQDFQ